MLLAILEDDAAQAELLLGWLSQAGHDCHHHDSGSAFLRALGRDSFDLLILDWGIPDLDGLSVLRAVRERVDPRVPVLFVTGRGRESDIVQALEQGADDYMVKPVRRAELVARLAALVRRSQPDTEPRHPLDYQPYRIDPNDHTVAVRGEPVTLTQKEFELAHFLFCNAGRLLSRGHILEHVWSTRADLNTRTVDTHISRIRNKLDIGPSNGWRLTAVYQHGYRLERLAGVEAAE